MLGKSLLLIFAIMAVSVVTAHDASAVNRYDVIVVRGDVPTDYTIASIFAGTKKIPLLLVDPDRMQDIIRDELLGYHEIGYDRLLIIGGETAISRGVEDQLREMGFTVDRLWDWSRYGTAARVAIDLWGESDKVIITDGEDYSGFLIAQKAALDSGSPILFIRNGTIPSETADAIGNLGARTAVVISNDGAVIDAIRNLGVQAERIGTAMPPSGSVSPYQSIDSMIYVILGLLVLIVILLSFRLRGRPGRSALILTEDEEKLVSILRVNGRVDQNRLAAMTDFSKPRISRMLRSLEERRVIEREKHKKTFRVKLRD